MLNCSWVICVPLRNEKAKRLNASQLAFKKIIKLLFGFIFALVRFSDLPDWRVTNLEATRAFKSASLDKNDDFMPVCNKYNFKTWFEFDPKIKWVGLTGDLDSECMIVLSVTAMKLACGSTFLKIWNTQWALSWFSNCCNSTGIWDLQRWLL